MKLISHSSNAGTCLPWSIWGSIWLLRARDHLPCTHLLISQNFVGLFIWPTSISVSQRAKWPLSSEEKLSVLPLLRQTFLQTSLPGCPSLPIFMDFLYPDYLHLGLHPLLSPSDSTSLLYVGSGQPRGLLPPSWALPHAVLAFSRLPVFWCWLLCAKMLGVGGEWTGRFN